MASVKDISSVISLHTHSKRGLYSSRTNHLSLPNNSVDTRSAVLRVRGIEPGKKHMARLILSVHGDDTNEVINLKLGAGRALTGLGAPSSNMVRSGARQVQTGTATTTDINTIADQYFVAREVNVVPVAMKQTNTIDFGWSSLSLEDDILFFTAQRIQLNDINSLSTINYTWDVIENVT